MESQWSEETVSELGAIAGAGGHILDEGLVCLPCYEPAGAQIELNGEDLTRNVLLTGSIGSGKTVTLNALLSQLIAHRAGDPEHKLGLLVYDFKQDDTVAKVRAWAQEAGREADLRVLSAESPWRLSLFGDLRQQSDVETLVEELLVAAPREDINNPYWEQARRKRLSTALGILRLGTSGQISDADGLSFIRDLYLNGADSSALPQVVRFNQRIAQLPANLPVRHRLYLESLQSSMREWERLDPRTRSNEVSTLSNALQPLLNPSAQPYLHATGESAVDLADIVDKGQIVVVSLPAMTAPKLAGTIGRLVKARFYRAVQTRKLGYRDPGRIVGCVADEFPMVVTGGEGRFSDVTQLQSMRSMRCFLLAASQGVDALVRQIGEGEVSALLANINTHFLFKTHEPRVSAFAQRFWGMQPEVFELPRRETGPGGYATEAERAWHMQPVCSPQALARLQPGQAYVVVNGRTPQPFPYWVSGRFFDGSASDTPAGQSHRDDLEHYLAPLGADAPHGDPLSPAPAAAAQTGPSRRMPSARQWCNPSAPPPQPAWATEVWGARTSEQVAAFAREVSRHPKPLIHPNALTGIMSSGSGLDQQRLQHVLETAGLCSGKVGGLSSLPHTWLRALIQLLPQEDGEVWKCCGGIASITQCCGLLGIQTVNEPNEAQRSAQEIATTRLLRKLYPNPFRPLKRRDLIRLSLQTTIS